MKTFVTLLTLLVGLGTARADDDARRDTAYIASGAAVTAVGVISAVVGGALIGASARSTSSCNGDGDCSSVGVPFAIAGVSLLTAGAINVAAGVPCIIYGARNRAARKASDKTISFAAAPTRDGVVGAMTMRF